MRRGFTLIELLVVIAVIALLIGILLPALGGARRQARTVVCGSRLQQLGVGLGMYWNDYDRTMPQATAPGFGGEPSVIGALFGGKKGRLPFLGINELGAERRPLNRYVIGREVPPDDAEGTVELAEFRSPLDRGAARTGVPGFESTDSMYDLIGSSYTLNDHAPDANPFADEVPTLVPASGGRMPEVVEPSRTWALGTHTIYNFDDGSDRGMRWFGDRDVKANLLYVDLHVRTGVPVADGQAASTRDYTFWPSPGWASEPSPGG